MQIHFNDDAIQPAEDRILNFPPLAQGKFDRLVDDAQKRRADQVVQLEMHDDLRKQVQELAFQIGHAEREKEMTGTKWQERDERRLNAMKDKKAKLAERRKAYERQPEPETTAEERRRRRLVHELNGAVRPEEGPLSLAHWLAGHPAYAGFKEKRAELPQGDLKKVLAKIEMRLANILDDIFALRAAPLDLQTVLDKMRNSVWDKAQEGMPDLSAIFAYQARGMDRARRQGDIIWPELGHSAAHQRPRLSQHGHFLALHQN